MSKEKFSKCEGGKNVSVEFRVFGRKKWKLKEEVPERKLKCFEWKLKLKLRFAKKKEVRDFYLLGSYPLVGCHVVNELKVA